MKLIYITLFTVLILSSCGKSEVSVDISKNDNFILSEGEVNIPKGQNQPNY